MPQFSRPSADAFDSGWTPSTVFSNINEQTPSDTTLVTSGPDPLLDAFVVKLSDLAWPSPGNQELTVRLRHVGSGGLPITVRLREGKRVIANRDVTSYSTFQNNAITLTSPEIGQIQDFTNLYVRVAAGNLAKILTAWYRADAITQTLPGGKVALWPDSTGNGNDALQNTSGSQPVLQTNQINGRPAVYFDGSDDFLSIDANFDFNSRLTVIVVARRPGTGVATNLNGVFGGAQKYSWGYYAAASAASAPVDSCGLVHHWGSSYDVANTLWTIDGFVCLAARYNGTKVDHWRNGATDGTTTGTFTPTFSGGAPYDIGWIDRIGDGNTSEIFQGSVAEIMLFDSAISDADLAIAHSYLLLKYNL